MFYRSPRRHVDKSDNYRVTIADIVSGENFRNRSRVLTFTVNVFVGSTKLIELPDVMVIDGRIQLPERRKRTQGGELRVKVVKPIYALLKGIYDALENTDLWDKYPDLPQLVPLINRGSTDVFEEEEDPPLERYRPPSRFDK